MSKESKKLIANNKKAYHEYFLEEKYEAGIALHGTEVSRFVWENVASKRHLCGSRMMR